MKKHIFLLSFFLLSTVLLNAQQESQFSQVAYTQLLTNPGYAGSEGKICAYALQRSQWTGFDGAPTVTVFNLDGIGLLSYTSVLKRDYPVIMASVGLHSLLIMLGNIFSDVMLVLVDPRIDYE